MTSIVELVFSAHSKAEDFDLHAFIAECDYYVTHPMVANHEIREVGDNEVTVAVTLHHELDDVGLQELAADLDYGFRCPETGESLSTELIDVIAKPF